MRAALALCLWASVAGAAANHIDTAQTVPQQGATFLSDLQTFLKQEDADRFTEAFEPFVASGCLGATAAGLTHTPTSCVAYPQGRRITESAAITYSNNATCWVILNVDTSDDVGTFTRVSGSHYLVDCDSGGPLPPTLPTNALWLMKVTTSGGAITTVSDIAMRTPTGQPLDVRDYGAIADGATDDSAAFARAISAATFDGYPGAVHAPRGQYAIGTKITIGLNAPFALGGTIGAQHAVQGDNDDGSGTTLINTIAAGPMFEFTANAVVSGYPTNPFAMRFHDLALYCDEANHDDSNPSTDQDGLQFDSGAERYVLERLHISGCRYGLAFGDPTDTGVVDGPFVWELRNSFLTENRYGIYITGGGNIGAGSVYKTVFRYQIKSHVASNPAAGSLGHLDFHESFFESAFEDGLNLLAGGVYFENCHWENNGQATGAWYDVRAGDDGVFVGRDFVVENSDFGGGGANLEGHIYLVQDIVNGPFYVVRLENTYTTTNLTKGFHLSEVSIGTKYLFVNGEFDGPYFDGSHMGQWVEMNWLWRCATEVGTATGCTAFISPGHTSVDINTGLTVRSADLSAGTSKGVTGVYVQDGTYLQFADVNEGAPSAAHCADDSQRGRLSIDSSNNRLYICNGASRGWDYIALTN